MKLTRVFLGADLRCSHMGLVALAKKEGIKPGDMKLGDSLLFINASKNRIKTLSWNGVLSYVNFEGQRRHLDLDAIAEIPRSFTPDGRMDYNKALLLTLEKKLSKKRFKEFEAL